MTRLRWLPGLALAAAGAAAGFGLHLLLPGLPWLTAALILGVIVGSIPPFRPGLDGALAPGLAVASRRLLRLGIVVLGLKLSLVDIARLGWVAILAIVALVVVSFVITWLIGRAFRLEGDQAVLMAAGFSICGVSAVGAMAAARRSPEKDTGTPITLVTLYGTLAIVVLPALAALFQLDARQFGHWVGASVHDVGQVVATAQTAGAAALAVAVVVKLTRVLMLAPMVAIASIQTRRRDAAADASSRTSTKRPPIVPLFIIGFLVAVLLRSFVPLPDTVLAIADVVQSALLATALFGIGASLRVEQLARSGLRAVAAGLVSWVVILGLALAAVFLS
ncbi:putative sulfate exporter family transporter [Glaciihabitans sp. INWT7]|uniref:YeiH family protein n=1 Tax=Glaciihabitans sp. INWT7 TaxID=2596912 RepID=UPI001625451E|nr:putative sulfate exporter family transporter [Glaciihabitans sp. INWT7]QNE46112.1 putative sulfate exporter family transporter [Glaciihabitans sp. INWT7]